MQCPQGSNIIPKADCYGAWDMTHKQGSESCIRVYAPEVINYTCIYYRDQLQCF